MHLLQLGYNVFISLFVSDIKNKRLVLSVVSRLKYNEDARPLDDSQVPGPAAALDLELETPDVVSPNTERAVQLLLVSSNYFSSLSFH